MDSRDKSASGSWETFSDAGLCVNNSDSAEEDNISYSDDSLNSADIKAPFGNKIPSESEGGSSLIEMLPLRSNHGVKPKPSSSFTANIGLDSSENCSYSLSESFSGDPVNKTLISSSDLPRRKNKKITSRMLGHSIIAKDQTTESISGGKCVYSSYGYKHFEHKLGVIDLAKIKPGKEANAILHYVENQSLSEGDAISVGEHHSHYRTDESGIQEHHEYVFTLKDEIVVGSKIDPSSDEEEDLAALEYVYQAALVSNYVPAQPFLSVSSNIFSEHQYAVRSMPCDVYASKKSQGNVVDRVNLMGKELGSGCFGSVLLISGVLKAKPFTESQVLYRPKNKRRVVKRIGVKRGSGNLDGDAIERESQLMTQSRYHKNRPVAYFESGINSAAFLSAKLFAGVELKAIQQDDKPYPKARLDKDKAPKKPLSLRDRYLLQIALVKALDRSVHGKHITHVDIKPENILVEKDASRLFWNIKVIDMGLSVDSSQPLREAKGTPLYVAPEVLGSDPLVTQRSDIYSMGRVIALVCWRDKNLESGNQGLQEFLSDRHYHPSQLDLFDDTMGLDWQSKSDIRRALYSMIELDPQNRAMLFQILHQFQNMYLRYELTTIGKEHHVDVRHAFNIAVSIDWHLGKLTKVNRDQKTPFDAKLLKTTFLKNMGKLPDNKFAIKMFKSILGLKCLKFCTNQDQIERAVIRTVDAYFASILRLKKNIDMLLQAAEYEKDQVKSIGCSDGAFNTLFGFVNGCDSILTDIKNCPRNLDDLFSLTLRIDYRVGKAERLMNQYKTLHEGRISDYDESKGKGEQVQASLSLEKTR